MKVIAYKLMPSADHLPKRFPRGDIQRDDAIVYPQGSLDSWDFVNSLEYAGTTPIIFLGWLNRLPKTDFPFISPNLPLMSEQMLNVLTGVGDFPHQVVPTRIIDFDLQYEIVEYLRRQDFTAETCNSNYFAIKLLEHLDVMDRERSEFERYESDPPDLPPVVTHLVMQEPEQGFPPLFRVDGDPVLLFVSPAAKEALEQSGIKGIRYLAYGDDGTMARVEAA